MDTSAIHDTFVVKGIDCPSKWAASEIHITMPNQSPYVNDMILYCTHDYIDDHCHKLSAAMPDATVRILQGSRYRITYKAGVRTQVRSMKDFYTNVDDEANETYKILNSLYSYKDESQPQYI